MRHKGESGHMGNHKSQSLGIAWMHAPVNADIRTSANADSENSENARFLRPSNPKVWPLCQELA